MFKNVVITAAFLAAIIIVPSSARAQDLSAALSRMDAIIKEMEQLRVEFAKLSATVQGNAGGSTGQVLGAQATKYLTQDLSYGVTNTDIERIQRLLATDPEIYPYGVASGFFGPKTQEAIKNFQTRFGLDPVGAVGPATTALLEVFFNAYPDERYPAGVLAKKPAVLGASTSVATTPAPAIVTTPVVSNGTNPAKEINVTLDDGEALIEIIYQNGNRKGLVADTDVKKEVVDFIARKTVLTTAQITSVISYEKSSSRSSSSSSGSYDEEAADDAIGDAEDELNDAEDEIDDADNDGDDTDWAYDTLDDGDAALDKAYDAYDDEDWDKAVKYAKEAKSLAKDAVDRIDEEQKSSSGDGDIEDVDTITAEIDDGETHVIVEYNNGDDDYEFDVDEDKEDKIVEAIADELDFDEGDVEDVIEYDYGKVSRIEATVKSDETLVIVYYRSGVDRRFHISESSDSAIIKKVAKLIDEDTEDVEGWIEID